MRGSLCLLALLTACGGATQSDVFGDPNPAPTGQPSGTATTLPPAPTSTSPPDPGDPKPCPTTTYYRDDDGDGFGGAVTQAACTSPGAGWATKGGDCDDQDKDVFPGQTKYFGASYSKGGGARSFDYDCNSKEDQKPPVRKAATPCTFAVNTCTGDGVVPSSRTGPGIDPLCGATQFLTCTVKVGGIPGTCDSKLTQIEAVACR
jgi:hypothetical protein